MDKETAIRAAEDRGDRESGDFMDAARQALSLYTSKKEPFDSYDVTRYVVEILGIKPHPEKRCLGGMFAAASRKGLIHPCGVGSSQNPRRHKGLQRKWIGA